MEANIDFTTYKSTITEISNFHTESLFGILDDEEIVYNIEDPFIFSSDQYTRFATMSVIQTYFAG